MAARHDPVWITEELGCEHLAAVASQCMLKHKVTSSLTSVQLQMTNAKRSKLVNQM